MKSFRSSFARVGPAPRGLHRPVGSELPGGSPSALSSAQRGLRRGSGPLLWTGGWATGRPSVPRTIFAGDGVLPPRRAAARSRRARRPPGDWIAGCSASTSRGGTCASTARRRSHTEAGVGGPRGGGDGGGRRGGGGGGAPAGAGVAGGAGAGVAAIAGDAGVAATLAGGAGRVTRRCGARALHDAATLLEAMRSAAACGEVLAPALAAAHDRLRRPSRSRAR